MLTAPFPQGNMLPQMSLGLSCSGDEITGAAGVKAHPLDPLTHEEIKAASNAVKAAAADKNLSFLRFNVVTLAVCCSPILFSTCSVRVVSQVHACHLFPANSRTLHIPFVGLSRSRPRRI